MLIFVQNFFDKLYMRITIIWVALSILLDFLWLIVHSEVKYFLISELVEPLPWDPTSNHAKRILKIQLFLSDSSYDCKSFNRNFDGEILQ